MNSPPVRGRTPIGLLLSRMEGVRQSGKGYRARCPSCGGKSPKVSLTETSSGTVLLHAFCGCSPAQVLEALDLTLAALFPVTLQATTPEGWRMARQAWRESQWGAALVVLDLEATVVLIAGRQIAGGEPLSAEDAKRLAVALARIEGAREVLCGRQSRLA